MSGVREGGVIQRVILIIAIIGLVATCALGVARVVSLAFDSDEPWFKRSLVEIEAAPWNEWHTYSMGVDLKFNTWVNVISWECGSCGIIIKPFAQHRIPCQWGADLVPRPPIPQVRRNVGIPGLRVMTMGSTGLSNWYGLRMNLGYPFVLFGLPVFFWSRREWRARQRRNHGLCVYSGYDLRGLPEPRCPECGRAYAAGSRELATH